MVNLFVLLELDTWSRDLNTKFTLFNCFLGAMKLTKIADSDKCGCSRYGIGFMQALIFYGQVVNLVKKLLFLVKKREKYIIFLEEGTENGFRLYFNNDRS